MDYTIEQVDLREQHTAVVRGLVPEKDVPVFLGAAFGEVLTVLGTRGLKPTGMPFGCYVPTPEGLQIEAGFPTSVPVEPSGRVVPSSLPVGTAVQVVHIGPYQGVVGAYRAADAWLADHGWEAAGPPWESYLDGPEVAEPRTIVTVPCRHP
ncbi:GyrI-like domain-containing protein [Cryobacterium cryoconiti]|nr:GyrI-like domain-containing protein [Cryobacterium cryoconiti]